MKKNKNEIKDKIDLIEKEKTRNRNDNYDNLTN